MYYSEDAQIAHSRARRGMRIRIDLGFFFIHPHRSPQESKKGYKCVAEWFIRMNKETVFAGTYSGLKSRTKLRARSFTFFLASCRSTKQSA